jgi:methionyl-tRNA formyltransferase
MKIAFFGLPLAALLLHGDGHEIVYAGICRPGAIGTRRLRARLPERVAIVPNVDAKATLARVRAAKPELLVSWFWTTRLPPALLAVAPLGALGVHPSLLPRHRGPDPYFWAIDAGDAETGVTAHLLADEYDTGAILGARAIAIHPSWNAWTLAKKLDRPSLALLREVVRAYADGRAPVPRPQDDALATTAPAPSDDDLEIRWRWPAERIVRRVRAAAPWPGAFTEIGGAVVAVSRAKATRDFPRALEPGEAAVRGGVAVVRAGDDAVELLAGRIEGDEDERELDASAIAAIVVESQGVS